MLKNYIDKIIKKFSNQEGEGNKKKIENTVTFLILLIITIIAINVIWKKEDSKDNAKVQFSNVITANQTTLVSKSEVNIGTDMEERLKNILSEIEGAGEVSVMISYSSTSAVVPVYNESKSTTVTQEDDRSGR